MARVILRRAIPGYRTVRGEVVRRIQSALKGAGCDPGEVDGVFGADTEAALCQFEQQRGLAEHRDGVVTEELWGLLTHQRPPELFERCLQITGDFEGQGFERPAGNFDGAGLTWGIIGFTLKHGEIQEVLHAIATAHPTFIPWAFGALQHELLSMLSLSRDEQLAWADGISVGASKGRLQPEWDAAFKILGRFPLVRQIQIDRARRNYWSRAAHDASRFGLATELGLALCFDVAVQNGGIDSEREGPRISKWIEANPLASERDRRLMIADTIAENSRDPYIEDVRARKRVLATGDGEVHASRYASPDWGLDDLPGGG